MSLLEMFQCTCEPKYTIEPHGTGYAIYYGRCDHLHGWNLARLDDTAFNCDPKHLEKLLNLGMKEYEKNPDGGHVAE